MKSLRSIASLAIIVALTATTFGCSGDSASPVSNQERFAGQFTLTSAEAQPLPATVFDGMIDDVTPPFHLRVVATSGSISIDANGHSLLQCFSNFLQAVVFNGTFEGPTLIIAQDMSGEGRVATYRYTWTASSP